MGTTTYINPVLVYATSALFMISILGLRDCSFCQLFGASLYRTLNSILCRSHRKTSSWLCSLEKKRESENIDHFCVFFKPFPREKADKSSFFDVSVIFFFFLAHVSREEKGNFIFIVFFYYTLLTGEGKGVTRNFHFTLILYLLTYNFHKSIKACVNFLN